jgi:hypothetical protein
MQLVCLKFGKDIAPKIAALLSQYDSVKNLFGFSTDEIFSTKITIVFSVSSEDLTLMAETELSKYLSKL